MEPSRRRTIYGLLLILLVTFVVFLPALSAGFPMDDELIATPADEAGDPRPLVAELRPLGDYFRSHWWRDHLAASDLYRPVTKLSIALVYNCFAQPPGMAALPQHLLNVLVHLWATALVFCLVGWIVSSRRAALAAALVFGVHALHAETVAEIVGRCDLFAFCFGAQALLLFMQATREAVRRAGRAWRLGLAAALAFLAFGSKEIAVAWVPFFPLFVLGAWRAAWGGTRSRAVLAAASVLVTLPGLALYLWLRWRVISDLEVPPVAFAANPLAHAADSARILTAIKIQGLALLDTALPIGLAADHGPAVHGIVETPADLGFLAAAAGLSTILAGGLACAGSRPLLFLATAAFFGFAFIVSNIPFAIGTCYGDRLYYLPSLGLSFSIAWLVTALAPHRIWSACGIALLAWSFYNGVYTFRRTSLFVDTYRLAEHDVEVVPGSARLQRLSGDAKKDRGDLRGALRHWQRAAELDPTFALSWRNLGALRQMFGDRAGAERAYREGLRRAAVGMTHERAALHSSLGRLLLEARKLDEAVEHHRRAVALDPGFPQFRVSLIDALAERGGGDEIEANIAEGRRRTPQDPIWSYLHGLHAARGQRWDEAEPRLRDAVRRNPGHVEAWLALATVLAYRDKRDEAVRICRRLLVAAETPPQVRPRIRATLRRLQAK